jgi:hypothetical protein
MSGDWIVAGATIFVGLVAIIAILCAGRSQREATAKNIYRDYIKLAFEHPDLANPSRSGLNVTEILPPLSSASSDDERAAWKRDERYRWFVAFMLNSCDEIASTQRRNASWHTAIFGDLELHRDYLMCAKFRDDGGWPLYSRQLRNIWENGPTVHIFR